MAGAQEAVRLLGSSRCTNERGSTRWSAVIAARQKKKALACVWTNSQSVTRFVLRLRLLVLVETWDAVRRAVSTTCKLRRKHFFPYILKG
jgi:hypothetical protein